jgi:CRISPR-associated protein Csm4
MRKKFTIVKLRFRNGLHAGKRSGGWVNESAKVLSADSIFSALFHAHSFLFGKEATDALAKRYLCGERPFVVSSAFPFVGKDYYVARPLSSLSDVKELKKTAFVPLAALSRGVTDDDLKTALYAETQHMRIREAEHVTVSRDGSTHKRDAHALFIQEDFYFTEDAGLYFFVEYDNAETYALLESLTRYLVDEGFGGDRSTGKGILKDVECIFEKEIDLLDKPDAWLLLSTYIPADAGELADLDDALFETVSKGGYTYSPHSMPRERKSVMMFREGAVFRSQKKGCVVDTAPDGFPHAALRNGMAFMLPIKTGGDR